MTDDSRRVVVTGVGLVSPIGHDLEAVSEALREGRHGVVTKPEWAAIGQLETRLAGEVRGVDLNRWPRKKVRSMGRVALLATAATERALADAGLGDDEVSSPRWASPTARPTARPSPSRTSAGRSSATRASAASRRTPTSRS